LKIRILLLAGHWIKHPAKSHFPRSITITTTSIKLSILTIILQPIILHLPLPIRFKATLSLHGLAIRQGFINLDAGQNPGLLTSNKRYFRDRTWIKSFERAYRGQYVTLVSSAGARLCWTTATITRWMCTSLL